MSTNSDPPVETPVACAGVVLIENGRLLVVQRRTPPALGSWTLPGGRIESGEEPVDAAAREALEETGLVVEVGAVVGTTLIEGDAQTYFVTNFVVTRCGGTLLAGSDAAAVDFLDAVTLSDRDLSPGLLRWLDEHGILAQLRGF